MAAQASATLYREKETKNTIRYVERNDDPAVGVVYVPKRTLEAIGNPSVIEITLTGKEI